MFFTINDEVKSDVAIECEHKAYTIFMERCRRLSLYPSIYKKDDRYFLYWKDIFWSIKLEDVFVTVMHALSENHSEEDGYRYCFVKQDEDFLIDHMANTNDIEIPHALGISIPNDFEQIAVGVSPLG